MSKIPMRPPKDDEPQVPLPVAPEGVPMDEALELGRIVGKPYEGEK